MKLLVSCMQCVEEQLTPKGELGDFAIVEIRDDGLYEFTCKNGHKTLHLLQQLKFEILLDIGAHAILDGYYREAVSSFTSCLEGFYEFYIKVIYFDRGINEETFESAWRLVSNQSERQLGAFIFLYTLQNGVPPKLLSRNNQKFRNEVIHKGKIPTKDEALQYGNAVLGVIRPILKDLREKHHDSVLKVIFQHLRIDGEKAKEKKLRTSTMSVPTIINVFHHTPAEHEQEQLLEEALTNLIRLG
jgi:hypothetical protein